MTGSAIAQETPSPLARFSSRLSMKASASSSWYGDGIPASQCWVRSSLHASITRLASELRIARNRRPSPSMAGTCHQLPVGSAASSRLRVAIHSSFRTPRATPPSGTFTRPRKPAFQATRRDPQLPTKARQITRVQPCCSNA